MMTNEIVAGLVVAGLPRQGIGYVGLLEWKGG